MSRSESRSHRTTGEARPVHPVYPEWQPPSASRAANTGPLPAPEPGFTPDVIVVGHGLSGLVATHEATRAGKKVLVVDQSGQTVPHDDHVRGEARLRRGKRSGVGRP